MFSLESIFKRSIAILLPVCFVWTFAACVMICTAHASEVLSERAISSFTESEFLSNIDCCPVSTSQLSVLPDRRSPIPQFSGNHPALCSLSTELPQRGIATHTHKSFLRCFPDLPLDRLCTLRI